MLEDFKKLLRKKFIKIKQKTYNVKNFNNNVNFSSSENFIDIDFENEKKVQKIVLLFKKLINIIFKFDWIANIDVTSHMIDQFRLFNKLLKSIKRRTIKIEKRKLYSNQCDTMMMKVKNDESRLTKILYVSNLEINLLFARRFIKCELRKNFNNDDLYMHIKRNIETLKVFARDDIYIVDKVALELNEFAYVNSSSKVLRV